jgi:hypothetical protein
MMKEDPEGRTMVYKSKLGRNGLDVKVKVDMAKKMVSSGLPLEKGEVFKNGVVEESKKMLIILHERNFSRRPPRGDMEKRESQHGGSNRNYDRS